MSPEVVAIHIPERLHLERRNVCQPTIDEPMMVRDDEGRVYVVVEAAPEAISAN